MGYLLDCNVLVALADSAHVHHLAAVQWFGSNDAPFATCPIHPANLAAHAFAIQGGG